MLMTILHDIMTIFDGQVRMLDNCTPGQWIIASILWLPKISGSSFSNHDYFQELILLSEFIAFIQLRPLNYILKCNIST